MKRYWMMAVMVMVFFSTIFAGEYRGGDLVKVASTDTLATDLFAGARNVYVDGVVQGDVYAGCETITVNGEVGDDVIGFCRQLTVRGNVGGMVIFWGQTLEIEGTVNGDVLAFGGQVVITDNAKINGNLFVGTGELLLDGGYVAGTIKGGAGKGVLNGTVGGDVDLEVKDIRFGEDYQPAGVTRLTLKKQLDKDRAGKIPANLEVTIKKEKLFFQKGFFYWSLFAMLITGILMVVLFKDFSRDILDFARQKIGKNFGVGALSIIAVPAAVVILLVLVITIPVGLIVLAAFLITWYLAKVVTALVLGNYLLQRGKQNGALANPYLSLLIGVVLVKLLPHIPFIGWILSYAIIAFGLGVIISYFWNLKQTEAA
ncbi:MAG: polymer-forming cytoskeletal protein [Calditrichaeota bacterium]|nr:MAG: polymer-forming cytoskeletal protein [Calditrichota bacterium]